MDEGNSMLEDTSYTENDEIDGSIISRIKKKRGVKVSGKYVPPLGWENIVASHPASSTNHYFEKLNDMKNFMDSSFQVHDNIKAKHPKQEQTSVNSDHTESDTSTIEHGKQITEMPSTTELDGTKMMEDVSKEKKKSRKQKIQITEKATEKSIPLGIPRETLEELKNLLKDSPIINKKKNSNFKHSAISHMQIPKSAEKVIENSNLTFETFRPRLVRDTKETQSINEPEEKHSDKSVIDQILTLPMQSQTDEQLVKEFDEKQSFVHDKANTSTGIKFDLVSTELTGSTCASIKDLEPGNSGIQNTLHLISHVEHIKQQIAKDDIHFVRFEAADLHGVSRSKTIPARFFHDKALSGIYMPRNYLELTVNPKDNEVDHINSSSFNSDIVLKPDLQTFRVLPWAEKTGRVICDSYTITNNPLLTSPRHLAKQLLNQLQEVGLSIHAAFTYEFCIFGVAEILNSKTIAFPAATLLTDNDHLFMQEVFDGMYYIGGSIESFSSSSGPGQMEISFQHEYGLNAADNAFTFRTCIKEVAKKHGCIASFYTDAGGYYNTGVLSHSLWDTDGNKNVFYSASHTEELTTIGKKWLSGLVFHSAALSCLVAPGVSCRKRFSKNIKESQESICATCGFNDNSCAYNIKCHGCKGTYIENKLCSATANPYLVLAATIAAGLDGIRRDLDYFEGTNSGAGLQQLKSSSIPLKLEDALTALEEDTYMRTALGEAFIHYFIAMKKYELETEELDSERNKFLEYFI